MKVLALHPIQVTVPLAAEAIAQADYPSVQGLSEIPKPYADPPSLKDPVTGKPNWHIVSQWHDQPDARKGETWQGFPTHSPAVSLQYYMLRRKEK